MIDFMHKTILVINSGSSSIKFSLLDQETHNVIVSGLAEELNSPIARISFKQDGKKFEETLNGGDHEVAMKTILEELEKRELSESIAAVGHRIVHGGEKFKTATLIDDDVIAGIEEMIPYAPLHNPAHLLGIRSTKKVMPNLPQVAVFDTAFHQTLPDYAYRYAVPTDWYKNHGVRRYGFHGTSYKFVTQEATKLLGIPIDNSALIIAHLGNGASLAAVLNGKSVDTTMGFTPLEGLSMGTRSGDIDAALLPYLIDRLKLSAHEIVDMLNKKSGNLGVSGISGDMRELEAAAATGHKDAQLAIDIFAFRVAKYIGALMTSLPRVDGIVFTAGVGENGSDLRIKVVERLSVFGYKLDEQLNEVTVRGKQGVISAKGTPTILVVNTNEELMIALDTAALI